MAGQLLSNHVAVETDRNVRRFDCEGLCQLLHSSWTITMLIMDKPDYIHLQYDVNPWGREVQPPKTWSDTEGGEQDCKHPEEPLQGRSHGWEALRLSKPPDTPLPHKCMACIVTEKDLCGWNVLHFNLFSLVCNCPALSYNVAGSNIVSRDMYIYIYIYMHTLHVLTHQTCPWIHSW